MATLTAKVTLTSTDVTTDNLDLAETENLTVQAPLQSISRVSVATSGQHNILTTSDASITYVYLKNIDGSNIIVVKTDGGVAFMDLGPGEMAFLPVKGAVGLEATATGAACVLEYGYWTKS
tara:strand:+ start:389 stop:751 length:363 start_codon:yes stop_codon:yes gene_type:complete